ncbi:MAG: HAD family hydrolase [Hyphomicrobiales bacterium]
MASHAVIFDIDGVLLHLTRQEETRFFDAFRTTHAVAEHHIDPDWNSYRVRNDVAIAGELLGRHFGRTPLEAEVRAVLDHYVGTIEDGLAQGALVTHVIDGAKDLLDHLGERFALHLGLATANVRGAAEARLRHAGLWGPFTACGYAESGGPKIEILKSAIGALRDGNGDPVPPDRVVFLGDQLGDLAAARENDVHFIGISTNPDQRRTLERNGAETVYGDHNRTASKIAELLGLE